MTLAGSIFILYRLSMVFLLAFQLLFLPLKYGKVFSGFVAVFCFLMTGLMDYINLYHLDEIFPELVIFGLQELIVQITALGLCRYRDFRAVFTGISSAAYALIGNMAAFVVLVHTELFWLSLLCLVMVSGGLLGLLIRFVRRLYLLEMESQQTGWALLCLIPFFFYTVIYALAVWPGSISHSPGNAVAILLVLILMPIAYVLILRLISQVRIESELACSNEFLEVYARGLRREMEIIKKKADEAVIWKHDARHIYKLIATYLEAGEVNRVKELLGRLDKEIVASGNRCFCENIAVNGILSHCASKADQQKIRFGCKADVPGELKKVDEFELATVVSNLLENAMDAAAQVPEGDRRQVELRVRPVKEQLFIEITNTFAGEYKLSSHTGLPLSRKGMGHGYGLLSVQAYARKHNALFQYTIDGGLFCVRLLVKAN